MQAPNSTARLRQNTQVQLISGVQESLEPNIIIYYTILSYIMGYILGLHGGKTLDLGVIPPPNNGQHKLTPDFKAITEGALI